MAHMNKNIAWKSDESHEPNLKDQRNIGYFVEESIKIKESMKSSQKKISTISTQRKHRQEQIKQYTEKL